MANVHASPADPNPTHHVVLDLNGQKWGLKLDRGANGYSIDEKTTESSFGALFSRTGKKYGNDPSLTLLEQREWTDGRGVRNYEDSSAGYFDAEAAWTLTAGYALPCPQWKRATLNRVADEHAPGSVMWMPLFGASYGIDAQFTTSSAYTATHMKLWVRRVGSPGNITANLATNAAGLPDTILALNAKNTADITDFTSVEADFPISQALDTTTIYHVFVYGSVTDDDANHWEVGCDDSSTGSLIVVANGAWTTPSNTFKMYYRVTPSDTAQRSWFFQFLGIWYVVTKPDTGTSQLFSIAPTGNCTEIAGTGLTVVSGRPLVSDKVCYFPQGEATSIRRWDGTNWDDDGGATNASQFALGYDSADGPQIWKVNNATGAVTVSRANAVAWGTDLVFRTAINCGEFSYPITSILWTDSGLQIFKENGEGIVSNDRYTKLGSGTTSTPSPRNGQCSVFWNSVLYYPWLNTLLRKYGGNAEDIGQAWRGKGLPGARQGCFAATALDSARMFLACDAGAGTSSIQVYNGLTWMEILRAPQLGYRFRDVSVQVVEDGRPRVWVDAGGDYFYFDMPKDVASPLYDPGLTFQHEFSIVSPTFDDGAARLSKYIREFTLASSNLNGSTIRAEFDYQVDEHIGGTAWVHAGNLLTSPEDTIKLHLGNIRAFRFRLRCLTDNASIPPVLEATVVDGFTRVPNRRIWNLRIIVGGKTLAGGQDHKAEALLDWLRDASQYPGGIRMTSIFPELHNRHIIVSPPSVYREVVNKILRIWKGSIVVSLMDVT